MVSEASCISEALNCCKVGCDFEVDNVLVFSWSALLKAHMKDRNVYDVYRVDGGGGGLKKACKRGNKEGEGRRKNKRMKN